MGQVVHGSTYRTKPLLWTVRPWKAVLVLMTVGRSGWPQRSARRRSGTIARFQSGKAVLVFMEWNAFGFTRAPSEAAIMDDRTISPWKPVLVFMAMERSGSAQRSAGQVSMDDRKYQLSSTHE